MKYRWRDGFHSPKGVPAEAVAKAVNALPEITPENLLEASKETTHVLHDDLWSEGDQAWARRGRLDRCRKIIGGYVEVFYVGGKEVTSRAVEYISYQDRDSRTVNRFVTMDQVMHDAVLVDALLNTVIRYQQEATAKLLRLRQLMAERGLPPRADE